MTVTSAICTTFKLQLLNGGHVFAASGGDVFKIALITGSPANSYGAATTSYNTLSSNGDEVSGTGYTAGGIILTNAGPAISGNSAYASFSGTPTWTSASFSTIGAIIYNTTTRITGVTNPAVAILAFPSVQTFTVGTFSLTLPINAYGTAIISIT